MVGTANAPPASARFGSSTLSPTCAQERKQQYRYNASTQANTARIQYVRREEDNGSQRDRACAPHARHASYGMPAARAASRDKGRSVPARAEKPLWTRRPAGPRHSSLYRRSPACGGAGRQHSRRRGREGCVPRRARRRRACARRTTPGPRSRARTRRSGARVSGAAKAGRRERRAHLERVRRVAQLEGGEVGRWGAGRRDLEDELVDERRHGVVVRAGPAGVRRSGSAAGICGVRGRREGRARRDGYTRRRHCGLRAERKSGGGVCGQV
jgi:hypothetical protein